MALGKLTTLLDMIKFEHTIFALPFAYIGMILGADGLPQVSTFFWITLAMVGARSFAMALNRLFDCAIDKKNPRTAGRALPAGLVSVPETLLFIAASLAVFFIAVFSCPACAISSGLWCWRPWHSTPSPSASPGPATGVLGPCLGLAPMGAWVAATNTLPTAGIWMLGIGVMLWTAGFDILYSCQDYEFDIKEGLHSVPVRFGIARGASADKNTARPHRYFFRPYGFFLFSRSYFLCGPCRHCRFSLV